MSYAKTCEYCNFTYLDGDPQDEARHDKQHRITNNLLEPKPLKRLDYQPGTKFISVYPASEPWLQAEMYIRARQLAYELKQPRTKVMWCETDSRDIERGFLLYDGSGTFTPDTIVGACSFRDRGEHWALQWVWFCPAVRGKGLLKSIWPELTELFGDFIIEMPLSDDMEMLRLEPQSSQTNQD